MDFTLLILLILFPIFTILIACRLVGYYLSDDFAHGYYMGKIAFVAIPIDSSHRIGVLYHCCRVRYLLLPVGCRQCWRVGDMRNRHRVVQEDPFYLHLVRCLRVDRSPAVRRAPLHRVLLRNDGYRPASD